MNEHVVLLAHGSAHPGAATDLQQLAGRVQRLTGRPTGLAYLGHAEPRLPDAVLTAATAGATAVAVVPLLLTEGYHAGADVLEAEAAAQRAAPGVAVTATAPVGPDPALRHAAEDLLRAAGVDLRPRPSGGTPWGVVLAAAGSSRAAAQAALVRLAEQGPVAGTAPALAAFATGEGLRVPDAVADLRAAGCAAVAVVPLVVARGSIASRIRDQARSAGADAVTEPLHAAAPFADLVGRRACGAAPAPGS